MKYFMIFSLYGFESLFVKVSIKLEIMYIGFRDASLCVSLHCCRRYPVAETRLGCCHDHSSSATGHIKANRGLQVFPSIVPTITEILLTSIACIRLMVSIYLHKKSIVNNKNFERST